MATVKVDWLARPPSFCERSTSNAIERVFLKKSAVRRTMASAVGVPAGWV
jgi:hypothetical protein